MSTLQKRKYIKKRGKKVAHHGTTKEKVIEYQTEKARVYQPGHLGALISFIVKCQHNTNMQLKMNPGNTLVFVVVKKQLFEKK